MATGVHEALADMLVECEQLEKIEALKTLTKWISEKKYLRDLVRYSFSMFLEAPNAAYIDFINYSGHKHIAYKNHLCVYFEHC
jgi:hypothetical protein